MHGNPEDPMQIDGTPLEHCDVAHLRGAQLVGATTARQVVDAHLAQIERFEAAGPALNAMVTVAADAARRTADELDAALAATGRPTGPLHGVPFVAKDNIETADLPTSYGSEPFAKHQPERDAHAVARLRGAGAVLVGKTSLPDWATSWFGHSSRSGVTRNPFDVDCDPGGSSAGTGAAVAASYASVGLGTDCGGSVRLPASFCGLVGVRSTPGVNSRAGSSPLVDLQDTVGPMTRTVADACRVYDVLAGHDPEDPLTAAYSIARAGRAGTYASALTADALDGRRIGVLRSAFGADAQPGAAAVNQVLGDAGRRLVAGGAAILDVEIDDLPGWLGRTSLYTLASKHDIDRFLAARPSAPVRSVDALMASGRYDQRLDLLVALSQGPDDPLGDRAFTGALVARQDFAAALVGLMEQENLDALVYPTCQVVPPRRTDIDTGVWTTLNFPTNTVIASQSWLPAISVPAGLADDVLPVGMEILTRPYDEHTAFALAHGFEQVRGPLTLPYATPMAG